MLSSRGSLAFTASPRRSTRTLLDTSVEVMPKPAPAPQPEPEPERELVQLEPRPMPASQPKPAAYWTQPMENLVVPKE